MQRILFLLILVLFFNKGTFAQKKITIAVMDLTGEGLSASETRIITSRLRTDLVNTNKFTVVEREKMKDILAEQGFQLSGCTSNECVVEVGKLLDVERIVAGEIGKIGKLFTLSIRMIDVQTGEILKTATEDCECKIEDLITKSVKNIVQILSGKKIQSESYAYSQDPRNELRNYRLSEWEKYNSEKFNIVSQTFKSLIVPGWGQFSQGRQKSGSIYLGIELIVLGFDLYNFYEFSKWTKKEDRLHSEYGWLSDARIEAGAKREKYERKTYLLFGALLINHFISTYDAFNSSKRHNEKLKQKYELSFFKQYENKKTILLCFSVKF